MFLIRSAFWLTAAFIALHPRDIDVGQTAATLSGQAMAAGRQIVAEQILGNDCSFIRCATIAPKSTPAPETGQRVSQRVPSIEPAMQGSPSERHAPVPRSRPAWLS